MAIFTPGPLVSSISGNLAGACFVNARTAYVVRRKQRPGPTGSIHQLFQLSKILAAIRYYGTLTEAQIAALDTAAATYSRTNRLGIHRRLTAKQLFVWFNSTYCNRAPLLGATVPVSQTADAIQSITLAFSESGSYNITLSPSWTPSPTTNAGVTVWISRPHSTQAPKHWAHWQNIFYSGWFNGPQNVKTQVTDRVGALEEGEVVAIRCQRGSPYYMPSNIMDAWTTVTA